MTHVGIAKPASRIRLRLWPGVVAVALQWLVRFAMPLVFPDATGFAILGALAAGALVVVWWLVFSRAPWPERLGVLALLVASGLATSPFVHESIRNGMMGMMLPIFAVPLLCLALVVSAAVRDRVSSGRYWALTAAAFALACVTLTLVRTSGITGEGESEIHWRWTPSSEERLLADARDEPLPAAATSAPAAAASPASTPTLSSERQRSTSAPAPERAGPSSPVVADAAEPAGAAAAVVAEWPGFRGPARDSSVPGVRIDTDWTRHPPVELWRHPIGPGWSSFAVSGDVIYTQEQRGEEEIVSAYRLATGAPVWKHRDPVRFWESNGGPGPRATPTVHRGRVYTLGATGIANALDAYTGALIWTRNAVADTGKPVPDWGIASSPLVFEDMVIVAVAGQLAAYDAHTGAPRWLGPPEGGGYSSPHLATIGGVPQILLLRGRRSTSVAPSDGKVLWEDSWQPAVSILQPAVTADGDVLIAAGEGLGGLGLRRIAVAQGPAGWTIQERWTSRGLKPYFNDFVVHEGHAYGFDGSILSAVDFADGTRKWKGGRYGHGQLLLLPDQDLLLVLSEDGELALVEARPDKFTELARVPALEGKTWNHPVLVGHTLLVRNGEQMAAFRLAPAER